MKFSLLKTKIPMIVSFCLAILLLPACSDSNRSGNNSTINTEVDTVGGVDHTQTTFVHPN